MHGWAGVLFLVKRLLIAIGKTAPLGSTVVIYVYVKALPRMLYAMGDTIFTRSEVRKRRNHVNSHRRFKKQFDEARMFPEQGYSTKDSTVANGLIVLRSDY